MAARTDSRGRVQVTTCRVQHSQAAALPHDAEVVVVPVRAEPRTVLGAGQVAQWFGVDADAVLDQLQFDGKAGSVASLPLAGLPFPGAGDPPIGSRPLLLFAGVGAATTTHWRRAGAAVAAASKDAETVFVTSLVPDDTAGPAAEAVPAEQTAHAFTEGLVLGSWKQPKPGSSAEGVPEREPTTYLLAGLAADLVDDAARRAESTLLARVLSTTPSNIKTPAWMARQATALAKGVEHLSVQVRDHKALRQEGFGGHLAVSAGSANPPRLVTLTWDPPQAREHVVLIGKGITFDTGGLSIKPREAMVPMKTDMTGSAVVLSTVLAAARSRLPVRLTGILALAENAVGASSYRPGDVVRVWGGRTVEVANTDAEGRMVLADALAWSAATLDPDAVLDVATLTGAATMGLGRGHGALFSNDDALAAQLVAAGLDSGEPLWRLPLVAEYAAAIESGIADVRHIPEMPQFGGGAITAALFLQQFAGDAPWAHLDIAGPARADRAQGELAKGPTGFGVRALLRWLEDRLG